MESPFGSFHTGTSAIPKVGCSSRPPAISVVPNPIIHTRKAAVSELGACTSGPFDVETVDARLDPSMDSTVASNSALDVAVSTAHVHAAETRTNGTKEAKPSSCFGNSYYGGSHLRHERSRGCIDYQRLGFGFLTTEASLFSIQRRSSFDRSRAQGRRRRIHGVLDVRELASRRP